MKLEEEKNADVKIFKECRILDEPCRNAQKCNKIETHTYNMIHLATGTCALYETYDEH